MMVRPPFSFYKLTFHGILGITFTHKEVSYSMHKKFDSGSIEKKWQADWDEQKLHEVGARDHNREKEYLLVEWPYPSGNLHIGHWYAFAVPDIYARYKRMNGTQVLFPMGFDAFGLPAENAAIKRGLDPKAWTYDNMAYMREQLRSMGNTFAWDKTTSSTDPAYYKWTQWMFTKFFENDIAYRGTGVVNWCPGCNTVIANEQVLADGTCERSGDIIEKREMPQWMLRITKYADRLTDDLDTLDWPEHIKEAQRQWIGRSRGAEIDFALSTGDTVTVFTTRPDTLFGVTYLVLAPEHPLVTKNETVITNYADVAAYVATAKQKDEQDRLDATKEKTGVKLEGISATNPANGEIIPVFVADYVLGGYGTGAIMAVPAHDERDFAFAEKFKLPVIQVVAEKFGKVANVQENRKGVYGLIINSREEINVQHFKKTDLYWLPGGKIEDGENETECLSREIVEETGYTNFTIGKKITEAFYDYPGWQNIDGRNHTIVYEVKLNDETSNGTNFTDWEKEEGLETLWVSKAELQQLQTTAEPERIQLIRSCILALEGAATAGAGLLINSAEFDGMDSEEAKEKITAFVGGRMTATYRIRDWSIGRQRYWGVPIPIVYSPEGEAHVVPQEHLPWLLPEDVDFTPTGEPPLAKSEALKRRTEEIFGAGWTPEVETMDTFVDSSWYFLRYLDAQNENTLASLEKQQDWMPIDIYFGGAEHTTMHLLYSRFWQKALYDLGLVTESEPYRRRINRGLILGPDGNKMSKSKGNVIDPDEQVKFVGADTVKMYLAFMGPYEGNNYPWDMGGIAGVRRFLERVYGLTEHISDTESEAVTRQLHKTIKKVAGDIPEFKFNTAISAMMIFVNLAEKQGLSRATYETFLRLLAPFAPHLTEEIWHELGHTGTIHTETYPVADETLAKDTFIEMGVQVNGKLRGTITIAPDAGETEALALAKTLSTVAERTSLGTVKKVIYVAGKILNIVVE
jgi:leucyl-tRNA synthetase